MSDGFPALLLVYSLLTAVTSPSKSNFQLRGSPLHLIGFKHYFKSKLVRRGPSIEIVKHECGSNEKVAKVV